MAWIMLTEAATTFMIITKRLLQVIVIATRPRTAGSYALHMRTTIGRTWDRELHSSDLAPGMYTTAITTRKSLANCVRECCSSHRVTVTGINSRMGAQMLVQSTVFKDTPIPITSRDSDATG